MWHIYKDDHSDLNFALGCLYCDAISLDEFKKWIETVILTEKTEDLPPYIYELLDFNLPLFYISKTITFNVINTLSKEDEYSIYGISYIRNNEIYDPPVEKTKAIALLKENQFIKNNFKRFFPFIEINFDM